MSGWVVTFDAATGFVAGPKAEARRRLAACGDRSPVWVPRRQAWATSVPAARDLLDQLEARNISARVEDVSQAELDLTNTGPANVLERKQGALW